MNIGNEPAPGKESASLWRGISSGLRAAVEIRAEAALILMGLLILLAGQATRPNMLDQVQWAGAVATVLGALFFLVGIRAAQKGSLPVWLGRTLAKIGGWLGVRDGQVIYVIASFLIGTVGALSIDFGPLLRAPLTNISIWLGSILLILLGTWRSDGARLPGGRAMLWGLALSVVAFALRGIATTTIPVALTGDEASMGISALAFIDGEANNPFTIGWFSFPALFYWMESLSIRLFGQTAVALRLPAALAGALTVGGVYLLGRAMFGRLTGTLAAIFLAGFHFHIHFSRLGLNNIWDGLAFVITLGALWYGWQKDQRAYFLLAGFWLGLAQYLYVSSRILFVVIPIWAGLGIFTDWERFKKNWGHLLSLGAMTLVIVAPLAWYFSQNPQEFMAPLTRVRLTPEWIAGAAQSSGQAPWMVVANQVWLALKGFTHEPLRAWYIPGTPLLRPAAGTLFILGLLLLLMRPKDNRAWLLLLSLLGVSLSVGLSLDVPASQRYVAAAPLAALLVGYGLGETYEQLAGLWPAYRRWLAVLGVLIMLGVAAGDAAFYFVKYTPATAREPDNNAVAQRLANTLMETPETFNVYFFGAPRMGFYSLSSLPYLAPHINGYDMNNPWGSPANPVVTGDHLIFVFLPDKEAELNGVRAIYPGGELLEERTPNGALVYWLYQWER